MSFCYKHFVNEKERATANITNMINIVAGEVAFDKELGLSPDYIDKDMSEFTSEMLTEIDDMCNEREPRVATEVQESEYGQLEVIVSDA